MIDVHAVNQKKTKQKKKKVHRFLQKKKMIDVQAINKRKQRKYIDSYNTEEKK